MNYNLHVTCKQGHTQILKLVGYTPEAADTFAGLVDGRSSLFVHSPVGTDSVIGKCGICGSQLQAHVEPAKDQGDENSDHIEITSEPPSR